MTIKLKPMQNLFMLNLLFENDGAWMSDIKPRLAPVSLRKELVKEGLIEEEKRKTPKGSLALYCTLSEEGWLWAHGNLDVDLSTKSTAFKPALIALLLKLKRYMQSSEVSLYDILCATGKENEISESSIEADEEGNLEDIVRTAYYKAANSKWNVRVRLHELRELLKDVDRNTLDKLLLDMQNRGEITLFKLDDSHSITQKDEDASINIGESKRHILYMDKSR